MQLQIRHTENTTGNSQFEIVCMTKGKHSEAICLTPPGEIIVKPHNISLPHGLQWYLEKYLTLPIETYQTRAEKIQETLRLWGKESFKALFGSGLARDWYQQGRRKGFASLDIKIVSDNPAILAWPWEALESETDGCLALKCHIERQLCKIADTRPPADTLPQDRLNILYIIARPHGEDDVGFQTLAKPLINFAFARNESWPVHIDLLRPPTFDRLLAVLHEKPGFYHIVHFDGHGGYGINAMNDRFAGFEGSLVFEKESGNEGDPISAEMLGELLSEHNIPVMVLNACRSAMLDERAETPFASVAASLIKAGVYSVVAMSYSLWVSGAKEFLSGFYRQLFKDGNVAKALRIGRQEMYRNNMRDSFIGKVKFNDWIVPVLYQQLPCGNSVLPRLKRCKDRTSSLPEEILDLGNYGFIGRDRAILQLEQAMQQQSQAGILIHGISGEGKTTLVKGFLRWLEDTNGLGSGAFWFSFEDIHSVDYIINSLAEKLLGMRALALLQEEMFSAIIKKLNAERFFLVWDNFESASGIPGTEVSGLIPEEGRERLKLFLHKLRGGKTTILITSRSTENWLPVQDCFRLPLDGLQGEELWQYCSAVVADLGLTIDRNNDNYRALLNKLDGNPLALRAILLRLKDHDAATLLTELEKNFNGLKGDDGTKRIQAALTVFDRGLDSAFAPVLRLLGLHEHSVDVTLIGLMLHQIKPEAEMLIIMGDCLEALESAGLCHPKTGYIYKLHPALHSSLSMLYPAEEAEKRIFVQIISFFAGELMTMNLNEQRGVFSLFGANFRRALAIARELDMRDDVLYLIQGSAAYAKNTLNFSEADSLFKELTKAAQNNGNRRMEAAAYHQLGNVTYQRHNFSAAEDLYKKSLAISQKLDDEHGMALTYHQLGLVVFERRDFTTAEAFFRKSLALKLKLGDKHAAVSTYFQLGTIAQIRHDLVTAEDLYKKSLKILLKLGDKYHTALIYDQLGMVAKEQRDFNAAKIRFRKSLAIRFRHGDKYGMASSYDQLGMVAQEQRNFAAAEDWYKKSLTIKLKFDDEYGTSLSYIQLGDIAKELCDFTTAEAWYKKALEILQRIGDEHDILSTYLKLGIVTQLQQNFPAAEAWYKKALPLLERTGDAYFTDIIENNLVILQTLKEDYSAM